MKKATNKKTKPLTALQEMDLAFPEDVGRRKKEAAQLKANGAYINKMVAKYEPTRLQAMACLTAACDTKKPRTVKKTTEHISADGKSLGKTIITMELEPSTEAAAALISIINGIYNPFK